MLFPYLILFFALVAVLAILWVAAWLIRQRDDTYQSGFDHGFLEGTKSAGLAARRSQGIVSPSTITHQPSTSPQ